MPSPHLLTPLLLLLLSAPCWALDQSATAATSRPDLGSANTNIEQALLPVDQAFVLQADASDGQTIALQWRIADGYYLYRHRLSATPAQPGASADALTLPRGKPHTDEFFGQVETFRNQVRGTLANVRVAGVETSRPNTSDATLALTVKYQGCADLGVCYPPQTRTISVAMPGTSRSEASALQRAKSAAAGDSNGDGLAALGRVLSGRVATSSIDPVAGTANQRAANAGAAASGTDALPLPPEQAFGFEAIVSDGNLLLLRFTPAPGYYLYRDRSAFRIETAAGVTPGPPRWPRGVLHRDEFFGRSTVYFDQVDVPLPLRRLDAAATDLSLVATFQGCQNNGICYPPMTRKLALSLPAGVADAGAQPSTAAPSPPNPSADIAADGANAVQGTAPTLPGSRQANAVTGSESPTTTAAAPTVGNSVATNAAAPAVADAAPSVANQAEDTRLASALAGSQRWLTLLGFFGAGLLLAFTPCVLPMIPILSGLIAGSGERIGAARAFRLSLIYVLASAAVFTIAGVIAGLIGANLQIAFQTPWVLVLFSALFVALALSMFGVYELQLPARWRAKLGALSNRQRGGSWAGVAAMGALSALIVGPCVAPPLAAAVLYIGQTRDPVFGGIALLVLALGMGAPLLAFGVAAGKGLPTSGPWMVVVQRIFGFVFIGMAVWMLSRILPGSVTLALYGLLTLAMAAWLLSQAVKVSTPTGGDGPRWGLRFAGAVFGLIGAAQLIGALAGGNDPLRPLAGIFGAQQTQPKLAFRQIKSLADLEREVAAAKAADAPLLLDFYADWCVACKEMEKYTFPQPEVHAALRDFVLLKADVTANDAVDQALMKQLGIIGPPATLYYVNGGERRDLRLFGFEQADAFAQRAQRAR